MTCSRCGQPIPVERLEALPDTEVCVKCSKVTPYTEATEGLVDGADPEDMRDIVSG